MLIKLRNKYDDISIGKYIDISIDRDIRVNKRFDLPSFFNSTEDDTGIKNSIHIYILLNGEIITLTSEYYYSTYKDCDCGIYQDLGSMRKGIVELIEKVAWLFLSESTIAAIGERVNIEVTK